MTDSVSQRAIRSGPPLRRARWAAVLLVLLVLVAPRAATAQQGPQVIPAGSLVIAMDNDKQNIGALFNLKAYGLAVRLLRNEVPVKWVINSTKPKDGIDFTATASRVAPTAIAATTLSFRGGPLVIHRAYAAKARTLITAFGGNVAVYELTQDVVADIHHELTFKPKPWVNSTNSSIATKTLIEAGIDDYLVGDQATISATSCYTIIVEPHNTNTAAGNAVRSFIEAGGNFYAQCASVIAFENHTSGRYMTTAGLALSNTSATQWYPRPNDPFSQFIGEINHNPGGSEMDFRLGTGSTYRGDSHVHAQANGITPLTWSQGSGALGGAEGGRVFYSGGHDHSGTALVDINLRRMFLNAILTPARRPANCNFVVATPDLTIQKTATGTFQEASKATYSITVTNSGTAITAEGFTVVDTLAAGVARVATAGTGWTFTFSGQVVTARFAGTLAAGAAAAFAIEVEFATAAIGTLVNRATVAGGGEINTSNNVATHVAVVLGRPSMTLHKGAEGGASPGSVVTYTLTFVNQGTAPAVDVIVVDKLPSQLQFTLGTPSTQLPAEIAAVVEYSRDDGATWTYQPVDGGCSAPPGHDGCVTHVRWRLQSSLSNVAPSNTGKAVFATRVK
jgi:uncharacterized repeat protein (TIGR01451 family)